MKKIQSKASKKAKKAKLQGWYKKYRTILNSYEPYHKRVLHDNLYLPEYEDGTVEVYCSLGHRPTLEFGFCYHLVVHGRHGNSMYGKWVYPPKDMSIEDIWKEACAAVDSISNEEIIDDAWLKSQGFEWD